MANRRHRAVAAIALGCALLAAGTALAGPPAGPEAPGLAPGGLLGPALRMVASLAAVLAVVGALAWLAGRLRAGGRGKSGLIEIVSGVSLGAREKVVLLRVGQEQVLVGVSPAGMRALHVMKDPAATPAFSTYLEEPRP